MTAPTTTPTSAVNVDGEGHPDIPWPVVDAALTADRWGTAEGASTWLSTASADGDVHVTGVAALWLGDGFWFISGPRSRKTRLLEENPRCAVATAVGDSMDVVLEGIADRVTAGDVLARVTAGFADVGWPAEPAGQQVTAPFWAPTAGPPPWDCWHVRPVRVHVVAGGDPAGAMRFAFDEPAPTGLG